MEFNEFKEALQRNFSELTKDATHLFEVSVDKDELWSTYLSSFPNRTNEIYRERTEHDCSCCRHFIKSIGNVVIIKDNQVHTIWDVTLNDTTYQPVVNVLAAYVKSYAVTDIYISKFKSVGTDFNHEKLESGKVIKWDHFYLELPDKFIDKSSRSIGDTRRVQRYTKCI